jgi:hypothetical protein
LAHAGGFDELLLFLVPVVMFIVVFRLARGRSEDGKGDGAGESDGRGERESG